MDWRQSFIRTFLERDLRSLGVNVAADSMRRSWSMLAHQHGQLWNASEIGRSFGVADTTVRGYLDKLTDALVVRQLKPWHENLGKRQVKAPKIYIRDTGLLHAFVKSGDARRYRGASKGGRIVGGLRDRSDRAASGRAIRRGPFLATAYRRGTGSIGDSRCATARLWGEAHCCTDNHALDAFRVR